MTRFVTIPSRAGFVAARNSGLKAVSAGFILQAAKTDRPDWRVGLTATRKTGNAVRRNRARRRLRELAAAELAPYARTGTDYVIIVRATTATRPWSELVEDMGKALGYLHRKMDGKGKHGTRANTGTGKPSQ